MNLQQYLLVLCLVLVSSVAWCGDDATQQASKIVEKVPRHEYTPEPGSVAEKFLHEYAKQNPAWLSAIKTAEGRDKLRRALIRNDMWPVGW